MRRFKHLILFILVLAGIDVGAQDIDFNVRYNGTTSVYEVYARPAFTDPFYFVGGGSQVSVLLPEYVGDALLNVTPVNGGLWTDNSQVYAPTSDVTNDFHGVATNGASVSFVDGVELLLFTFTIAEGCVPGVRLFENASDPNSSAPGMGGGDFQIFFANVFDPLNNNWRLNYLNTGLLCPEAPVVLSNPITIPQGGTTSTCLPILDLNTTDSFTATLCAGSPANGTSTPTISGNTLCLDYTPTATFVGQDDVCIIVCDVSSMCDTVSVPVTVVPALEPIATQEPPVVIVTPITTAQDSTVIVCTEILDHNVGDTFTSSFCGGGQQNGTATATITGNTLCLEYVPNPGFTGEDDICIIVCDQDNNCDAVNIPVSVIATPVASTIDQNPTLVMPPVVTPEDVTLTVCGPIIDPNVGDVHTVSICGQPENSAATATVNDADNSLCITVDPNPNFFGTDSICVEVCDQTLLCYTLMVPIEVTPVNDPPLAVNDVNSTQMNLPVGGNVLTNDSDVEGETLTVNTTPLNVTNGTVVIDALGNYTYTPTTDFVGNGTFQYEVCDNGNPTECSIADVVITVIDNTNPPNENNPVQGVADNFTMLEGGVLSVSVLSNDSDPDNDNLIINTTPVSGTSNGTLVINPDGTIVYTPTPGYFGTDEFTYEVCDDGVPQTCADVIVSITILQNPGVNTIFATDDASTGEVNLVQTGNVTDNDNDPENGILTVTVVNDVSNGTLILNTDGTFTYTPNTDYIGGDQFVYQVCDDGSPIACDVATMFITVTDDTNPPNGNNPVQGVADNFTMLEGGVLTASVLSNDSDPDGDNLIINTTPVSGTSNGTLVINPDGTIVYTPTPGYFGTDEFTYEVCDDGVPQSCVDVLVSIIILEDPGVNTIFATDDASTDEVNIVQSGNVTDNDNDPENGILAVTVVSDVSNGSLTLNTDGTFTYTPNTDYVGSDQFVYQVCDDGSPVACDVATVYIQVLDAKDAPVVLPNPITVSIDSPGSVCSPILDPDVGDTFTVTSCTGSPTNGVASVNIVDGNVCVDYTPNTGYTGTDDVCVIVCDQTLRCDTVSIPVTVVPLSTPSTTLEAPAVIITPITVMEDSTVNICTPIMDQNVGDSFTATFCAGAPDNGTASTTITGNVLCVTYTPDAGYTGSDDLCIEVCDQTGRCDFINVPVSVIETFDIPDVAQAPVLVMPPLVTVEDTNTGACGSIVDVNVSDEHTVTICGQPVNGSAVATVDNTLNSLCIDFDPNPNFIGSDSVCVTICDQGPLCFTLMVPIEVIPANDPPLAIADINNTQVNVPTWGNVLTNDSDPDGDNIIVNTTPINVTNGTVTIDAAGNYTFVPDTDFIGDASFEYEVCDDSDPIGCTTQLVSIAVVDVSNQDNNEVIGMADHFLTEDDAALTASLLSNDSDPDGDNITINTTPVSTPTNGTLVINPDGTFTYTPVSGIYGVETFSYEICDDGTPQDCDIVPVTITIVEGNGNNDIYATDDSNIGEEDATFAGNVLTNDNDPEGDALTVSTTPLVAPVNGTVAIAANGDYTYVPNTDFTGNDQFVYLVCDGGSPAACDSATVYITVLNVSIELRLKVMLQGALFGATDGLMRSDLVDLNLVPLSQPYDPTAEPLYASRFTNVHSGDEVTTPAVLAANSGTADGIVDWVFIEFRDPADGASVLRTMSALVQRDGDVVDAATGGVIYVDSLPNQFYTVVKHRNHLGAMTVAPVASINKVATFDFTTAGAASLYNSTAAYDSLEQVTIAGHEALWAGNANADGKCKYDGPINDRFIINANVVLDPLNTSNTLNFDNAINYYLGDINMDGKAKYDGFGNDRILLQSNVLTYPLNASYLNNYDLLLEQVQQ